MACVRAVVDSAPHARTFLISPRACVVAAGVGGGEGSDSVLNADVEKWRWVEGVNFWGVLYGSKLFGEHMVARAKADATYEGHIVNTASMAGQVARGPAGAMQCPRPPPLLCGVALSHRAVDRAAVLWTPPQRAGGGGLG